MQIIYKAPDADFTDANDVNTNVSTKYDNYLAPDGCFDAQGQWQPNTPSNLTDGEPDTNYSHHELDPYCIHRLDSVDSGGQ